MWTQDQVRNWSVVMPVLRSLMAAKGGRSRSDSNMMGLGRFIRHISYGWGFIDPVRIISAMRGMTEGVQFRTHSINWVGSSQSLDLGLIILCQKPMSSVRKIPSSVS